jgi:hypothetical protein
MQVSRPIPTLPGYPSNITFHHTIVGGSLSSSSSVICRLKSRLRCLRLQELVVDFVATLASIDASKACSTGVSSSTLRPHTASSSSPRSGAGADWASSPRSGADANSGSGITPSLARLSLPSRLAPSPHSQLGWLPLLHHQGPDVTSCPRGDLAPCQTPRMAAGISKPSEQ